MKLCNLFCACIILKMHFNLECQIRIWNEKEKKTNEVQQVLQKKSIRRKRGPKRTYTGAPLSIESTTGTNTIVTVDYSKKSSKLTQAEKTNLIEKDGIVNIPDGFGWTDVPFPPKEP